MDNHHPIVIRQVSNGYMIEPYSSNKYDAILNDCYVFSSITELHSFLDVHFAFREGTIKVSGTSGAYQMPNKWPLG